ncbi:MAG: polyprenyl synthetase family protein, partial [Planctomycetota bacterium]|nr:polyprenyl synthetase family protein [Planctomycetota bacterium]
MEALQAYFDRHLPLINKALDKRLPRAELTPSVLHEAMRYSVLGGGKRVRPILCLLACESCGAAADSAMAAACAVEFVHTYRLIHDDLPAMDDDDLRRGRPSCHAQFGEATAILAGDALLAQAFEVLAKEVVPPELAAVCCGELAHAAGACNLVGGQQDDLDGQ